MLVVANWKAYVTDRERARGLLASAKRLARATRVSIVLAPPSPLLGALARRGTSRVAFAAQDISASPGGALTGEATAEAYRAAGATYAIIGHSERRARGDTDAVIGEKLVRARTHELTPILCVGEEERDGEGKYLAVVREELTNALTALPVKERARVIIAYEPLWAIGKTAADALDARDLAEMVLYIRKVLAEFLPGKSAARTEILYGGSVEPENVRALAASSGVDGFLVGHASVEPRSFSTIVKQLS